MSQNSVKVLTRVSLLQVSPVARGVLEGGEVPRVVVEVWFRYVCLSSDLCGVKQGSGTDWGGEEGTASCKY